MMQDRITDYFLATIAAALTKRDVGEVLADAAAYASRSLKQTDKGEKNNQKADLRETVSRLYRLYPSKTIRNNIKVSTGKCVADKRRIERLLKEHTAQEIEDAILQYLDETKGVFLKNFSTFLNNLPEPVRNEAAAQAEPELQLYKDI